MKIGSQSFIKNIFTLATGSIIAQGIAVLITPFITRIYAPEMIGTAAVFVSVVSVITVISCLRYELSILLPELDSEAVNLLGICFISIFLISTAVVFTFMIFNEFNLYIFSNPQLNDYVLYFFIAISAEGIFLALNYWETRKKNYGLLSLVRIIRSITTNFGKIVAGIAGFASSYSLIIWTIIGTVLSLAVFFVNIFRNEKKYVFRDIKISMLKKMMIRYKRFPLYSSWSGVFNIISWQAPIWIISYFFNAKIVGFFALGHTVLTQPMKMFGSAISQVFFQRISEEKKNRQYVKETVREVFQRLVSFGIYPICILVIVGKEVFSVIFGLNWSEAGLYSQYLAIFMFFQFISSPISSLFSVFEIQNEELVFNIMLTLTKAAALIAGGLYNDIILALVLFSIGGTFCYALICLRLLLIAGVELKDVCKIFYKYAKIAFFLLIIIGIVKWKLNLSDISLMIISAVSIIIYYSEIIRSDEKLKEKLRLFITTQVLHSRN
jgi:O-antigen/teichoic acid export membrane protein